MNDGQSSDQSEENSRVRLVDSAKQRLSSYGSAISDKTIEQADVGRLKAAEAIEHAAEDLRQKSLEESGLKRIAREKAADSLLGTGHVLHDHSVREVGVVGTLVRSHPMLAVFVAFFIGYMLGKMFSGGGEKPDVH